MNKNRVCKALSEVIEIAILPVDSTNKNLRRLQMVVAILLIIVPIPTVLIELFITSVASISRYIYTIILLVPSVLLLVAAVKIQLKFQSEEEKERNIQEHRDRKLRIKSELVELQKEGVAMGLCLFNSRGEYEDDTKNKIDDWEERVREKLKELDPNNEIEWNKPLRFYHDIRRTAPGKFEISLTSNRSTESDALQDNTDWANYLNEKLQKLDGLNN